MPQPITKTGSVDLYRVSAPGNYTYLMVEVDGQKYTVGTSNKNPTAFPMAAIMCLKDAFLQGKQVTVVGRMTGIPPRPLNLTSIELH
jgi:S-adenosylhomocysteine hydrolase